MKGKRCGAWLLTAAMLTALAGCAGSGTTYQAPEHDASEDDSSWQTAAAGETLTLENDAVRLVFDADTTHFTVENKAEDLRYSSTFAGETAQSWSADTEKRMRSELTLVYYEEQSSAQYMFSDTDSVALGQYRVTHTDDRIRVTYTFGVSADNSFVPRVFGQEKLDAMLDALRNGDDPDGASMSRRMLRFYTLYTAEDADNTIRKAYPAIEKTALYILDEDAGESDIAEVREYLTALGYTREDYAADLAALGIENDERSETPGFVVPVEYSLQADGFSARVLTDRIEEISDAYKLQSLTFLEYFASAEDSDGQFFVPDGSGALIDWEQNHVSTYSQPFYGADYSIQNEKMSQLAQNSCLPVYGILRPTGSVLTIVEEGAENGTLYAESPDCSATPNHIYTLFTMRHMDTTDIGADQLIPVYNLFVQELSTAFPTQRYVLLGAKENTWQAMAQTYRRYLLDTGGIRQADTVAPTVYLTYLGMTLEDANFLGIPYDRKIVLSTLEEIEKDIDALAAEGIKQPVVRLTGFSDRGLTPKANDRFSLSRKLGSTQELTALSKQLQTAGGRLYTDGGFQFVYGSGNGFSKKTDSAHYLNRVLVKRGDYDPVTRFFDNTGDAVPYFASPKRYANDISGYLTDASGQLGVKPAVSYGTAGRYLGGDYTSHTAVSRTDALHALEAALETARSATAGMSFDTGNAYVLPYADDLYDLPLTSSRFDAETAAVPFYPMVIHGLLPYCGSALNLSYDRNEQLLRSVEYGAALSYILISREDGLLTGTALGRTAYSLNSGDNLAEFVTLWQRLGAFQQHVAGQTMTDHTALSGSVFCTTYADGSRAYVNYSDDDYTAAGLTVKAHDLTLVIAGEEAQ